MTSSPNSVLTPPMSARILEQIDSDIATCAVCTQQFTDPRLLACSHTFCIDCLRQYADGRASASAGVCRRLPCPLCRQEFEVPDDGLERLPKNLLIANLVERLRDVAAATDQRGQLQGTNDEVVVNANAATDSHLTMTASQTDMMFAIQNALEDDIRSRSATVASANSRTDQRSNESVRGPSTLVTAERVDRATAEAIDTMLAIELTLDDNVKEEERRRRLGNDREWRQPNPPLQRVATAAKPEVDHGNWPTAPERQPPCRVKPLLSTACSVEAEPQLDRLYERERRRTATTRSSSFYDSDEDECCCRCCCWICD